MTNVTRKLVSGNKARFRDEELDIELDLVYLTDNVIIMGFPADGVEALYRNDREHTRRFLEHRHGKKYWIFNFCPLSENSYPAEFFGGRVSRYPFPDHHAPPLAIMALAAREIDAWLRVDPDRVVVLHCKAGKGRSGTLACSYLLSLEDIPNGPSLERSYTRQDWANKRAAEMIAAVTTISDEAKPQKGLSDTDWTIPPPPKAKLFADRTTLDPANGHSDGAQVGILADNVSQASEDAERGEAIPPFQSSFSPSSSDNLIRTGHIPSAASSTTSLDDILALHSSRRMKPVSGDAKPRKGVSIPSQRRFLFYWSQILSNTAPRGFWGMPSEGNAPPAQRVRIPSITVRIREIRGTKAMAVKIVNGVLEKTSGRRSGSPDIWVSLARYDDQLVNRLEGWEKRTRSPRNMGRRRPGSETLQDDEHDESGLSKIFESGKWDASKMVRTFARLRTASKTDVTAYATEEDKFVTYLLHPLPQPSWVNIGRSPEDRDSLNARDALSDRCSIPSFTENEVEKQQDIIVEANREVRAKLFMGQIPMGWFWFVPTFHIPDQKRGDKVHLKFRRSEIDFPLGPGYWISEVDVELEWIVDEGHNLSPIPSEKVEKTEP